MKKLLLITILSAIAIGNMYAQIKTSKTIRNTQNLNLATPPPPPPTNSKTSGPISNSGAATSVYTLTSARVNIRTGNDNKEFPSRVYAALATRNTPSGVGPPFHQFNLNNEMKINSDTEFGLDRDSQLRREVKLDVFQSEGLKLIVSYTPKFSFGCMENRKHKSDFRI